MRTTIVALAPLVAPLLVLAACSSSSFHSVPENEAANDSPTNGGAGTTPIEGDAGTGTPSDSGPNTGMPPESGSSPADAQPAGQEIVVTNESVSVWGNARTYTMVAPKDVIAGKAYPLVFVFHGDGGNGAGMRSWIKLDDESKANAIVVYPDGKYSTWDLYTIESANEDDAFVDAMLAAVKAKYTVDPNRVFGSGYSSGAFFINQLACRRTGFFRAIAPNAGGAPEEPSDPAASKWAGTSFTKCANQTGGVAAIVMHGNDDTTVGTGSGTYTARYWAHVNGCDDSESNRTATTPSPCVQHASCPTGQGVVYCEIAGIGHGIWNESGKASWGFFSSF